MDPLVEMLRSSRRTVVFTGAGVSTLSGLPDFRGEHGLNKTATALGLKYDSLKKHLATEGTPEGLESARVRSTFLELLPGGLTASRPECTIEWADRSGMTVRMHVRGIGVHDLVVLARGCRDGQA